MTRGQRGWLFLSLFGLSPFHLAGFDRRTGELAMNSNAQIYEAVTARILECLDKGVVPWRKPWAVQAPQNLSSGHVYRGINPILLSCTAFSSPYWVTYKQAKALGGNVKRGESGTPIVFWKVVERKQAKDNEDDRYFLLQRFYVFNVEQTEGIYVPKVEPRTFDPIAECEKVVSTYQNPPSIVHRATQACYMPALDRIWMPAREAFTKPAEYYSTLFHELAHSTGGANRLARKGVVDCNAFASHTYSFEELVAECTSAFLAAQAGISSEVIDNSAAYIQSWARKLRSEPKWMVNAASQAAKAADLILGKLATTGESSSRSEAA
jgi:antirestriction protein ArdC